MWSDHCEETFKEEEPDLKEEERNGSQDEEDEGRIELVKVEMAVQKWKMGSLQVQMTSLQK